MSCSIGDEAFPLISAGQDSIAHRIPIAICTMQMNTLPIIDALDPSVSGGKIKGTGCESKDLSVMGSLFPATAGCKAFSLPSMTTTCHESVMSIVMNGMCLHTRPWYC